MPNDKDAIEFGFTTFEQHFDNVVENYQFGESYEHECNANKDHKHHLLFKLW